jgi:hypothetical protein
MLLPLRSAQRCACLRCTNVWTYNACAVCARCACVCSRFGSAWRSGAFVPKAEIESRLNLAQGREKAESVAKRKANDRREDATPDTEGLQATVSLSLNFLRQVKKPLQKAREALREPDEKELAQVAQAEAEFQKELHSRLVRGYLSSTVFPAHDDMTGVCLIARPQLLLQPSSNRWLFCTQPPAHLELRYCLCCCAVLCCAVLCCAVLSMPTERCFD